MADDANALLEKSLREFGEKFETLEAHFGGLMPIGEFLSDFRELNADEPDAFVRGLVEFSAAILNVRNEFDFEAAVEIRRDTGAAFEDLPVPPYDLWLPFKAEGSTPNPNVDLAAAIKIFNEAMGRLASTWQAWKRKRLPQPEDPRFNLDVIDLMLKMREVYRFCKNCCNKAAKEIISSLALFVANSDDELALLMGFVHPPVQSRAEFETFMIVFHKVFYDGLKQRFNKLKKDGHLTGALASAEGALKREFPQAFQTLRHRAAHSKTEEEEAFEEVANATETLIGLSYIAPDNAAGWTRLQKTVIIGQLDVLNEIVRAFTGPDATPGPGA